MNICERSVSALGRIITGDEGLSPYRSGPVLVKLFNEFGANDIYGQGFPSRWDYAEQKIRVINGTSALPALIRHVFDPRDYIGTEFDIEVAIEHVNKYLAFDNYEIAPDRNQFVVRELSGSIVPFEHSFSEGSNANTRFIDEQLDKCDKKIAEGDFDGAITNARSLLEAILSKIEADIDPSAPQYNGDLLRLYKRVQKNLDLEPSRKDIDSSLKQVLTGMVSIVNGLAAIRNRMSDAHVLSFRPSKRHAKLVVNAAKTVSDFLLEVQAYREAD